MPTAMPRVAAVLVRCRTGSTSTVALAAQRCQPPSAMLVLAAALTIAAGLVDVSHAAPVDILITSSSDLSLYAGVTHAGKVEIIYSPVGTSPTLSVVLPALRFVRCSRGCAADLRWMPSSPPSYRRSPAAVPLPLCDGLGDTKPLRALSPHRSTNTSR